jgi:Immunity protein 50
MSDVPSVPGVAELVEWFGYWPSFHDSEVTRVHLNRSGPSYLDVHTFRMTSELTASGHYVCDKHVIVTFEMEGLLDVNLQDFNDQNVVSGIGLKPADDGIMLTLFGCYGLVGNVRARAIKLGLAAGIPDDSMYRETTLDTPGAARP